MQFFVLIPFNLYILQNFSYVLIFQRCMQVNAIMYSPHFSLMASLMSPNYVTFQLHVFLFFDDSLSLVTAVLECGVIHWTIGNSPKAMYLRKNESPTPNIYPLLLIAHQEVLGAGGLL